MKILTEDEIAQHCDDRGRYLAEIATMEAAGRPTTERRELDASVDDSKEHLAHLKNSVATIDYLLARQACATLSDAAFLSAYQRTTGEPGDPEEDALLAEIEWRGVNV